jgi:hypothetical protein
MLPTNSNWPNGKEPLNVDTEVTIQWWTGKKVMSLTACIMTRLRLSLLTFPLTETAVPRRHVFCAPVVESERAQFQQNHLKCVCAFNRAACILRL